MNYRLRFLLLGFLMTIPVLSSLCQVSISNDNSIPDPSSMLDVRSTDRGILIPRMTHAQLAAIPDPANGLIVFCTDCGAGVLSVFVNGSWNTVSTNCMTPASPVEAAHTATRTQIT